MPFEIVFQLSQLAVQLAVQLQRSAGARPAEHAAVTIKDIFGFPEMEFSGSENDL